MEPLFIPTEHDFKRWVKEAVQEYFQGSVQQTPSPSEGEDNFINRKEVAGLLQVSLVTLTDWMKRGLPFYKQRGRVYFIKSEVLKYIRGDASLQKRLLMSLDSLGDKKV